MSDIPLSVRRQLRQEAGFGCCVCGLPFIQYHHIIPREVQVHNRPEDMMVLCPNHHDQATKRAMLEAEQRRAKGSPFNISRGYVDGLLKVNQEYCAIDLGTVQMVGPGVVLRVDGENLLELALDGGRLAISMTLYDEADNALVLVEENEWIAGNPQLWDLEADHQKLLVRLRAGDIRLFLKVAREPMLLRARLYKSGYPVEFRSDGVWVGGEPKVSELAFAGMGFEVDTSRRGELSFIPHPKYGKAVMVSEMDPIRRVVKAVQALREMEREHHANHGRTSDP